MRQPFPSNDSKTLWAAGAVAAVALAAGAWAVTMAARRGPRGVEKRRPDMPTLAGGRGARVERTVTVLRSPEELYALWRDLTRLPELMTHLESVTPLGDGRTRWTARGPGDIPPSWDGEVGGDAPGRGAPGRGGRGRQGGLRALHPGSGRPRPRGEGAAELRAAGRPPGD